MMMAPISFIVFQHRHADQCGRGKLDGGLTQWHRVVGVGGYVGQLVASLGPQQIDADSYIRVKAIAPFRSRSRRKPAAHRSRANAQTFALA